MIKKLLFLSTSSLERRSAHLGLLLIRLFAGLTMAFAHGAGKVPPSEGFISGVDQLGFPLPFLFAWGAALSEFVGGILVALGLMTRPSSLALVATMSVAAFLQHAPDPFAKKEMALLYLFIFLLLFLTGPGKYSLDSKVLPKHFK